MKKRIMLIALALIAALAVLTFAVSAEAPAPSEGLDIYEYSAHCLVKGIGTCTDTNIVIPALYNGKPVIYMSGGAFRDNESITSIRIPATIQTINADTFSGCTSLKTVTFEEPDDRDCGGTFIYPLDVYGAFVNCPALEAVFFPKRINVIGEDTFFICENLSYILFGNDLKVIKANAFYDCPNLLSAHFDGEKSVWETLDIDDSADFLNDFITFEYRRAGEFKYEHSAEPINEDNEYAFTVTGVVGDYTSEDLVIPSYPSESECWFYEPIDGWDNYEYYYGPVTSVGDFAFWVISFTAPVKTIVIPDSIESIGQYSFAGLESVENLIIGSGLEEIGENALILPSLKHIEVSADNAKYRSDGNCLIEKSSGQIVLACAGSSIPTDGSIGSIGTGAFVGCCGLETLVIPEVTFPYGIYSLSTWAINDCVDLRVITLPSSISSIFPNAIANCDKLEAVYYLGTEAEWSKVAISSPQTSGWLDKVVCHTTHTSGETLFEYTASGSCYEVTYCAECGAEISRTFHRSSSGLEIEEHYDYCAIVGLGTCTDTDIIVPSVYNGKPIKVIGEYAFYHDEFDEDSVSITSIVLPDSVTHIMNLAFACSDIEEIVLPKNLLGIGSQAFSSCLNLKSVTIPSSTVEIDSTAFDYCTAIESLTVKSGNTVYHSDGNCIIETATKKVILGCKNSVIPGDGSVTSIGDYAFSGQTDLTSITIPDSVTSIGKGAFLASGLTSVAIPDGVKEIAANTFFLCENLDSVVLPENLKKIGSEAFASCASLDSIVFPENIEEIGDNAFASCYSLAEIVIPDSVNTFGIGAFEYCTALKSVKLSGGLSGISDFLFVGCSSLETIEIPSGVMYIGTLAFGRCSSLEKIAIPSTIYSISRASFDECTNLKAVYYLGTEDDWYHGVHIDPYGNEALITHLIFHPEHTPGDPVRENYTDFGSYDEVVYCTECELELEREHKEGKTYTFHGATVSTAGYLYANYYVRIDDVSELDDIAVRFTFRGEETTVSGSEAVKGTKISDGKTYYYFSLGVPAKNMGDNIRAELISSDGKHVYDTIGEYSVKTYYMKKLSDGSDKMKAVSVAALNYGAAAQLYFGYDTDNLVNAGLTDEQKSLAAAPETPDDDWYQFAKSGSLDHVTPIGETLVFKADTRIRFYFEITDGDGDPITENLSGYTFSCGETIIEPVYADNFGAWYAEVSGIAAKDLGSAKTVTVSDGSASLSITYSPTTYIYNKYTNPDESLGNIVKAMYLYHTAAVDYASK